MLAYDRRFQSLPVTLVAQGAEYAAAEATAVAHDNARAVPVFISGATGNNAAWMSKLCRTKARPLASPPLKVAAHLQPALHANGG
jgi:hypothetical protein